jgi:hypothetical protein
MKFNLINRVTKRDPLLLYAFYALKSAKTPSVLRDTCYERLAVGLTDAGCKTARGVSFTAAVVRASIAELERAGAACREETEKGRFNLCLLDPDGSEQEPTPESQFENETQEETRQESEPVPNEPNELNEPAKPTEPSEPVESDDDPRKPEPNAAPESNEEPGEPSEDGPKRDSERKSEPRARVVRSAGDINKINKLINKTFQNFEFQKDESKIPRTIDAELADFDFGSEYARKFRAKLTRAIYEPGLHADLVDRAIYAVAKKLATPAELVAAIDAAKEERRLRDTTNGYKGARTLWQTFCLYVKSWFDAAGIAWTPTSLRREPAPKRVVYAEC